MDRLMNLVNMNTNPLFACLDWRLAEL
jgi:hypothetical protein